MLNLTPGDRLTHLKEDQHDTLSQPVRHGHDAWSILIGWLLTRPRIRFPLLLLRWVCTWGMPNRCLFGRHTRSTSAAAASTTTPTATTCGTNAAAELPTTFRRRPRSTSRLRLALTALASRHIFSKCCTHSLALWPSRWQYSLIDLEINAWFLVFEVMLVRDRRSEDESGCANNPRFSDREFA